VICISEQIYLRAIFEARKDASIIGTHHSKGYRKLYHLLLFSYASWSPTWTVVSCASLHAAFISGSYQPEGRSAVKVGKLIGVPRRFTALFSSLPLYISPLPLLSPILFDRFPTFRKVAALIKRKTNNPVAIQWSCLFPRKLLAIFGRKNAIVRLAFRSFYFLTDRLSTFRTSEESFCLLIPRIRFYG